MPDHAPTPLGRESAVGLLEILIVLFLIAVMLTIGLHGIRSARSAGTLNVAIASAQDYASAIDRFRRDHNGRYPRPPGSADWPGGDDAIRGPRSASLGTNTYLRKVPEAVQSGIVVIGARGDAAAGLNYRTVGTGYEIVVDVRDRTPCALRGGGAAGVTPTCSKR